MDEIKIITLTPKELISVLIKHENIHEGIWQLYTEFGLSAGNMPIPDEKQELQLSPAAIVSVNKIGLIKVDKENPLALDASKVNSGSK